MSGDRFEFDPYGRDLTGLATVIEWAADEGRNVAKAENNGDSYEAQAGRQLFESRLSEMPRNSLGGFHIFGDAAITAYSAAYAKYRYSD
jgi:hypothetical protein